VRPELRPDGIDASTAKAWFEDVAEGILVVSEKDHRYVAANKKACDLVKRKPFQMIGALAEDIVIRAIGMDIPAAWDDLLQKRKQSGICTLRLSDGREKEVAYHARASVLPGLDVVTLAL